MHALAFPLLLLQTPTSPPVELGRLLWEKADPVIRARLPAPPYRLRAISPSRRPDQGLGEFAIAELDGPGALVRIETRGAAGTIRIRVDGAEDPVLERPTKESWILDLPIPFAARCRVTADGANPETCEIEYRAYSAGTSVVSATRASLENPRAAARPVPTGGDTFTFSMSEEIPEGSLTCIDPKNAGGPRAITRIHLRAEASDLPLALAQATLRLAFDGETTVECPLGNFFGCPSGAFGQESPYFTITPGIDEATGRPGTQVELVCNLVMPYRARFDFSIDAKRAGDLHVAGILRTMGWLWDDRTMRLHVSRANAKRIEGKGVLVGESILEVSNGTCQRRMRMLDAVPFESGLDLGSLPGLEASFESKSVAVVYYYALPDPPRVK